MKKIITKLVIILLLVVPLVVAFSVEALYVPRTNLLVINNILSQSASNNTLTDGNAQLSTTQNANQLAAAVTSGISVGVVLWWIFLALVLVGLCYYLYRSYKGNKNRSY